MSLEITEKRLNGIERIFENVIEKWFNEKELEFLKEHDVKIISRQTQEADYDRGIDTNWDFEVYVDNKLVWTDWAGASDYATSYIEEEVIRRYNESK